MDSPEEVEWPPELEISVEYCTRNPFHARFFPEKYLQYFNATVEAFQERYPQTKIVGNPFTGRRPWKASDKLGPLNDDVEFPRLGSFEVAVKCDSLGVRTIFSKLATRRWPNPRVLVCQVERLLRGQELLKPTRIPPHDFKHRMLPHVGLPGRDAVQTRRFPRQAKPRCGRNWDMAPSQRSKSAQPGVSPMSSDATSPSPISAKPAPRAETSMSGSFKASSVERATSAPADDRLISESIMSNDTHMPEEDVDGQHDDNRMQPVPRRMSKDSIENGSDAYSGFEDSVSPTTMWMPGAAQEEKWEAESNPNRNSIFCDLQEPESGISNETVGLAMKDEPKHQSLESSLQTTPADPPLASGQAEIEDAPCAAERQEMCDSVDGRSNQQIGLAEPQQAQEMYDGEDGAYKLQMLADPLETIGQENDEERFIGYTGSICEPATGQADVQVSRDGSEQVCAGGLVSMERIDASDALQPGGEILPEMHLALAPSSSLVMEAGADDSLANAQLGMENAQHDALDGSVGGMQPGMYQPNSDVQLEDCLPAELVPALSSSLVMEAAADDSLANAQLGMESAQHDALDGSVGGMQPGMYQSNNNAQPQQEALQGADCLPLEMMPDLKPNSSLVLETAADGSLENGQLGMENPRHDALDGSLASMHEGMYQSQNDAQLQEQTLQGADCLPVEMMPDLMPNSSLVLEAAADGSLENGQHSMDNTQHYALDGSVGGMQPSMYQSHNDGQLQEQTLQGADCVPLELNTDSAPSSAPVMEAGADDSLANAQHSMDGSVGGMQPGTYQPNSDVQLQDCLPAELVPALAPSSSFVMEAAADASLENEQLGMENLQHDAPNGSLAGIQPGVGLGSQGLAQGEPSHENTQLGMENLQYDAWDGFLAGMQPVMSQSGNDVQPQQEALEGASSQQMSVSYPPLASSASVADGSVTDGQLELQHSADDDQCREEQSAGYHSWQRMPTSYVADGSTSDAQPGFQQSPDDDQQWEEQFEDFETSQPLPASHPALEPMSSALNTTDDTEAAAKGAMIGSQSVAEQSHLDAQSYNESFDAGLSLQESQRWEDSFEDGNSFQEASKSSQGVVGSPVVATNPAKGTARSYIVPSQINDQWQDDSSSQQQDSFELERQESPREVTVVDDTGVKSSQESSGSRRPQNVAEIIAGAAMEEAVLFAADLPMYRSPDVS